VEVPHVLVALNEIDAMENGELLGLVLIKAG